MDFRSHTWPLCRVWRPVRQLHVCRPAHDIADYDVPAARVPVPVPRYPEHLRPAHGVPDADTHPREMHPFSSQVMSFAGFRFTATRESLPGYWASMPVWPLPAISRARLRPEPPSQPGWSRGNAGGSILKRTKSCMPPATGANRRRQPYTLSLPRAVWPPSPGWYPFCVLPAAGRRIPWLEASMSRVGSGFLRRGVTVHPASLGASDQELSKSRDPLGSIKTVT